jgi:ribosomal protein S27AE
LAVEEDDAASPESEQFKVRLKRRKLAGRKKLCPKCLSPLVIASPLSGWLVPEYYACTKCGYSGHVALEEMPKEK